MESVRQELERRAARLFAARGAGALRPAEFAARLRPAMAPAAMAPAAVAPLPQPSARPRSAETLDFSLMFFSAAAGEGPRPDLYRLVHAAARFADARGFSAIWLPERHFHPFGGPYPDPASLAASLAPVTSRLRLRAGSVVLPLHHPVAVAERWSVVDNLSGGRVELAFGSGWNPNDFVLSPETFADSKGVMRRRIEEVRALWRGGSLSLPNGRGESVPTRIFPAPLQPELPVWVSATGNPETFAWAGGAGFGILTMLLGGEIDDLAPKIAAYRAGRAAAGLDPEAGRVGLMLHSFVHPDGDFARAAIRAPFLEYVRSSVDVQRHGTEAGRALSEAQREQIVAYAFERYTRSAALFGTPAECRPMLERVAAAGVDEVACLVDFGVDEDLVIGALEHLDAMRPRRPPPPPAAAPYPVRGAAATADEPVAIIGMAGRFPGAPDLAAFWNNLLAGRSLIGPPPPGRGSRPGGYLDDIAGFDAGLFGIAPAEAAAMDPHQRIFLEQVHAALEDAGLRPAALRGSDTGVFAAIYSHSHEAALRRQGGALDGLAVAGAVLSMVPNRTSFLFDWTGPSEAVNTACSSGLVAVHRAAAALRAGECGMAVAGGVSLLLAPEETDALAELGILSPSGACRAFDRGADGQVRGEGAGVVVLKRLADAERDGDFIHAVIRGSAVNHGGARAASLTLPNPRLQAACIEAAIRRSGVDPARIGYVEAHGAGTAIGDLAELSALEQALGAAEGGVCLIGSVKPNIGSLDAAGGIAGLIKAVLALRHGRIPPSINRAAWPDGFAPGRLRAADTATGWAGGERFAGVHAYGLGGTNAHVVLAAHPDRRPPAAPGPRIVSLAARDGTLLRRALASLLAALDAAPETPLADVAHTLQAGRAGGAEGAGAGWRAEVADTAGLRRALRARLVDPAPFGPAQAAPAQPGRRIPLPATPFARPAAAGNASPDEGVVGAFYDFVTRAEGRAGEEIFLTLAPLPAIVPGFSWTRTFQDPERHAAHWRMMQDAQREMRAVLFDGVDFASVRHMIDFGCGVGADLIALARRHPHLTGTGYTISPRQAAIAGERIAAAGLADRLEVRCADSAHTPFPQTGELIFGFEVAHHIADKEALFANLAAHLHPGGWLVLADCAANTLAPIDRPDVGSFTSPKPDYAALLARHGFAVEECVDVSAEIANFLHDPDLEMMIADERSAAPGRTDAVALMAAVQRSWDGFGQALRAGVISYLLLTARKLAGEGIAALNRQQMGLL